MSSLWNVVLVVQVQAETKPCAGLAESCFLRGCNGIVATSLKHLGCACGISESLYQTNTSVKLYTCMVRKLDKKEDEGCSHV
jgi:hypothetical protein